MPDKFLTFNHTEYLNAASFKEQMAWIDYQEGQRTLFVAHAPSFVPICIDHCHTANHQIISNPKLSPSGQYLIYTRTSLCSGNKKDVLILVNLINPQQPIFTKLLSGKHVCFDEKNNQIFYVQDAHPNCITLFSLTHQTTETLWSTKGSITYLTLAEKTRYLAFTCKKSSRCFTGFFSLTTHEMQWIDPSFDMDHRPSWSPSEKQLALIRYCSTPHAQYAQALENTSCFSIVLYDLDTKNIDILWNSKHLPYKTLSLQEGCRPLYWLNNDYLVFCHEGTSYEHAYLIHCKKKIIQPISSGNFVVRDLTVCPHSQTIYLATNQYNKQGYNVVSYTTQTEHTPEIHASLLQEKDPQANIMTFAPCTVGGTGRYIAYLSTSEKHSCHIVIFDKNKQRCIVPKQPSTNTMASMTLEVQTLKSKNEKNCLGYLMKPKGEGLYPGVIYLHDGPGQQSISGFHPALEMSYYYAICRYLVQQGFVVLAINYRGSDGCGRHFREAKLRGWHGASEYRDILTARKWLEKQNFVKKNHIALMGKGWGGYLTALGLARDSQLFRAGIDIHGYHHFPRAMRSRITDALKQNPTLFTCTDAESATHHIARAKLAVEFSPWDKLDHWMSPVLLVHGDENDDVPFTESQALYNELNTRGVQTEYLLLPGETHTFTYHSSWSLLAKKINAFLKKHISPCNESSNENNNESSNEKKRTTH